MTKEQEDIISEFETYLVKIKGIGKRSRKNYLSWSSWLMDKFGIETLVDEEGMNEIVEKIKVWQNKNKYYKTQKDIYNFKSTLRRFIPFNESRIRKEELKNSTFTIDQMIDSIACQDTAAHAIIMNEAIRLLCYDNGIKLSEDQKNRMKTHTQYMSAGQSHYTQIFADESKGVIYNN